MDCLFYNLQTPGCNASSPCRTCGGAGTKPQASGRGSRSQLAGRPHGRSPLSLKSSVERAGLLDMGTQTTASALRDKSTDVSNCYNFFDEEILYFERYHLVRATVYTKNEMFICSCGFWCVFF